MRVSFAFFFGTVMATTTALSVQSNQRTRLSSTNEIKISNNDMTTESPLPLSSSSSSSLSSSPTLKNRRDMIQTTAMGALISASTIAFSSASLLVSPRSALASDISDDIIVGGKIQLGEDTLMAPKDHGTTSIPVQDNLKYGVSQKLSDKICSYNRHFAENSGYYRYTNFEDVMYSAKGPVTFYDSVTGKPLFQAPIGRSLEQFVRESEIHGWPSFRDEEVIWDNVRVLKSSGETVSVAGTHLGHNLPDKSGNRYCINLVSIAGNPV